jgi:hypothetical protein
MKMLLKQKIMFFLLVLLLGVSRLFGQSIGPVPGEIYYTGGWYFLYDGSVFTEYSGIIHSKDSGRTFQVIDTIVTVNPEYFFDAGWVLADATPGILYRITAEEFFLSLDHAQTWEQIMENQPFSDYATGNVENEIFRRSGTTLFKSTDNAGSWTEQNDSVTGRLLGGRKPGEVFYFRSVNTGYNAPIEMTIYHSLNDGVDFVSYQVDTTVTGVRLWYMSPHLLKGPEEGEFYVVSWWSPNNFKIFRSLDYGQSFTLQYEEEIPTYCNFLSFAAGRGECEFYYIIYQPLCTCSPGYARFTVLHSDDCGTTFSEYYHEMTPSYSGLPSTVTHTIAVDVEPKDGGNAEGDGKFPEGDEVNLIAEPSEHFVFKHWSLNGAILSDEPEFTFNAYKSMRVVANFEILNSDSGNVSEPEVILYPNPSNSLVTIRLPDTFSLENTFLEIYNIQGQRVTTIPINEPKTTFDISSYQAGIYLYTLKIDNEYFKNGKLTVVK